MPLTRAAATLCGIVLTGLQIYNHAYLVFEWLARLDLLPVRTHS